MQKPAFSIYDASAGSGKTYTLVKEYLKIILASKKDDAYRNILAITFTNKAVHEMKSRIVDSLSEFTKDEPNEKAANLMADIASEIHLSLAEIKQKSKNIIRHIIHNYAAFDISTIDKFTHKVIRAFAHDLNLPVTFEVSLDTENLLTEAVDALIAQAGEDEILTKLLVDFTMEKTDDDKSWDISRDIMETGRLILNENNRNEITHFHDKTIPEFVAIKEKLLEASKCLDDDCIDFAAAAIALIESKGIDTKSFSGEYFPKHLGYIQRKELKNTHKKYREFEDIKINKNAHDRELIEAIIPELLQTLAKVYENHEKRDFYNAFLKNITPLSLLNTVSRELTKIQKEQNILSIAEFNKLINDQIQNQPAPFIYERLGERYQHFFIDEFQDTSEMQWQNLIPLIDNATSAQNMVGESGSLMIVGDPKQSIYRWRGGKAEQFIALGKDHNPFNNPDKRLFSLDRNYRSHSQVIDFNNDFFGFISGEFSHPDYRDLYENHSRQNTNDKTGGYVNISFIPKAGEADDDENPDKTQLYVQKTLKTIHDVQNLGFEYKDIAVLTRKRDHGIAIANYLTEQSIPILSSETLMIANATEVRLIIYLLKYLKNSNDLESKANFLQYIGAHIQNELPLHDFIAAGMQHYDEPEFEAWLAHFDISLSFRDIRKKSLYEAVEIIVSKFVRQTESNAYIQFFLDIVLERDIKNQAGISDFLDYWEKNAAKFSIPSPEGSNSVRIMTIHKSKGLEFPVVIFPFAEEDYSRKPKDKLWLDSDSEVFGLPKVLIDNSSAVENFGQEAALVFQQKKQEELLDNINVLYVALTRAEEQLYIISSMNLNKNDEPPKSSLSTFFIKYLESQFLFDKGKLEYDFGKPEKKSSQRTASEMPIKIKLIGKTINPKAIKIAQRESLMWGTHQQEAIEYGNVVHEILSFVKTKGDIAKALALAIENGLITSMQENEVRNAIEEIVGHQELESYFSDGNRILNEQAIIQNEGLIVKPDRMVLTASNEVYLLDYKTGLHNPKYLQQLQGYQDAIEKMGYRVTKKALVYIGEQINVLNL
ncbi:MAG TPA: UvrD-helicase domain-containing protein [Flavobacterium sp.]|nr:UvrD-helicase domain-containing protein [Flavobacterium sp.]